MAPSERDDEYWWYGWGWYRKRFTIDAAYGCRKRLYLIFVRSDRARLFDRENVLAVEISNRRNAPFSGIPPMTAGNWNVYGGIYRDVRIVIKDKLHIPFQGSADHEGGTFVTTPEVTEARANVRVKTYVKNDYNSVRSCTLETTIVDAEGCALQQMTSESPIAPGEIFEFDQTSPYIPEPKLWSPETPHLYRVHSRVLLDGETVDHYDSPLGFRWFHWDYEEKRLYLNGKKVHINGTNRHQEYPWLGDAIPKWMHEMDLKNIKYSLGHNFLRTCHYTQDPMVYELCDRYGILACEEVPNIKNIEFSDKIQELHVKEMIRRDRNHPSIVM